MEFTQSLLTFAYKCFDYTMAKLDRSARAKWKEHVNKQMAMGGGKLFKYVSVDSKHHLTVGIKGGTDCDPSRFIVDEHGKWSALWNPDSSTDDDVNELMEALDKINQLADSAKTVDGIKIDFQDFKHVLKTYHKDSKGVDNWTASDLARLPYKLLMPWPYYCSTFHEFGLQLWVNQLIH